MGAWAGALILLALLSSTVNLAAQSPSPRAPVTNEWLLKIVQYSDTTPAIAMDNTVYFGTWIGELWAITPDGKKKWTFKAGRDIASSPAIGTEGTIYFGSRDRKFYALDKTGRKRWTFSTGAWVDSSPALGTNGTIYFGSWDKTFYSLAPDGHQFWNFKTDGPIVSSPVIGLDGTLYFGSHDGKLYALAPDGTRRWDAQTGGSIVASPAFLSPEKILIPSTDGYLYALDAQTGKLLWRLRTGGVTPSSPAVGTNETIYLGVNTDMWVISAEGKKLSVRGNEGTVNAGPTLLADGSIVCVNNLGGIINFRPEPDFNWRFFLYGFGNGNANLAVGPNGKIFCTFGSQHFTCLDTKVPLVKSIWPTWRGNPRNTGNLADSSSR